MPITTVLLDAGGIIIDESEIERFYRETISGILSRVAPDYTTHIYDSDIEEAVRSYCPNVYEYVLWKYSENDLVLFDKLHGDFRKAVSERRPPLRLQNGFASEARKITPKYGLAIAGQYGAEILRLLETNGVLDYFAHKFTQDDFAITKPDPRYFEQIAHRFGARPEECVMVGDRIDKDVIPAKQLGMKTILVRVGLHKNQRPRTPYEIPDMEIAGIEGLSAAIDKIAG